MARDQRRGAALCNAAPPGHALVSSDVAVDVADALPPEAVLVDAGIHRLADLSPPQRIFLLRRRDDDSPSASLRTLDGVADNLPVELTTFVGRAGELAAVSDALRRERLVTLVGAGGCGKSRLASHAAAAGVDR